MNKEEFRKHCEQQIERCIKLNDHKHLREHELALSLLNECDKRKEEKQSLVKYLENEINFHKDKIKKQPYLKGMAILPLGLYQGILEKVKSGKYE